MKFAFFRFGHNHKSEQKPVIIDAEDDIERERGTGRIIFRKPTLKEKIILVLQMLGGILLTAGLFLLLLPVAIFLAVAVSALVLAFLIVFWWHMRKHRPEMERWRSYVERLFGRL
ncbi:MAG: hypothetical protein C4520_12195 [Candidatus Abyssobacteria bacterium SURF_5]|uniref:Uncharacterized protein n=1 Tax=Abyssobacteria bacterium (strain SURF_5) TaxID=2093360 RepID=A0A3A4NL78_ABYX5|nr:MAG: hypothetical protein C4520_12195 [Candidatus Abyssubacteria bacterium SURF_5]